MAIVSTVPDRVLISTGLELLMSLAEKLTGEVPVLRLLHDDGVTRETFLAPGAAVHWITPQEARRRAESVGHADPESSPTDFSG